ncbi:uncharacterized protein LOC126376931 [Pectinophora gossypiella]|uniref:uncharacterized protein LOC126376931 n=1 Tax=Pectinophora gossypiella TaxID=13191 RepID=UPI00214E4E44|nr:uncharacterized protein LOC126376931 [Pectinophora gossypiella]
MSEGSETPSFNVYEERLDDETAVDLSNRDLETVPALNLSVVALYLQNNRLVTLPDDFFPSLPSLVYLDLRDNRLTDIPTTIQNHPTLTHLLLQNNCLTSLPNELGTLKLKLLQLNGNPLMYPPREVISAGVDKTLAYLQKKHVEMSVTRSKDDLNEVNETKPTSPECLSYNSVIDGGGNTSNLVVELNEKDQSSDEETYAKFKRGKCPKLDKSRHKTLSPYCQSAKYLKPLFADKLLTKEEKIKQNYLKDIAIARKKDLLASQDRILQERKNLQSLRNWRSDYRNRQYFNQHASYRLDAKNYPYDTSPEYMTLLTREDIEKDLPDKYRKSLTRRCKPTVARRSNNDVNLAIKIKKLFENLEAIDLNRDKMTPRTEQKALMSEIQKISEIKQKLTELSTANISSV